MSESYRAPSRGMVAGHGLDIVDISDFSRLLHEPASKFLDRHFTETERRDAGEGANQSQKLAGRFAVKEAVMKALGVGWGDGISFTDVEVAILESGAPTVTLHRRLVTLAQDRNITDWFVSISHSRTVAVASVIAVAVS
jgi:holo-[acyl-carrier protein] synthase